MSDNITYFNLVNADDTAVVRILHSSVSTVENVNIHFIQQGDKKKSVKCVGEGCPLCAANVSITPRVYIHLLDYSSGVPVEKVWARTDKILPQLEVIEKDWGRLCDCVLRITRQTKEFPKYTVTPVNAAQFPDYDKNLVDQKVSYRFYLTRSVDELNQFLNTGIMPKHESTYLPKEEYLAQKNATNATPAQPQATFSAQVNTPITSTGNVVNDPPTVNNNTQFNDVFVDPFASTPTARF